MGKRCHAAHVPEIHKDVAAICGRSTKPSLYCLLVMWVAEMLAPFMSRYGRIWLGLSGCLGEKCHRLVSITMQMEDLKFDPPIDL